MEKQIKDMCDLSNGINAFTSFLNNNYKSYRVEVWGDGEGISVLVDDIEIRFWLDGDIKFLTSEE